MNANDPCNAHSLAEIHLLLMVSFCHHCGQGPLAGGEGRRISEEGMTLMLEVPVHCPACNRVWTRQWSLPHGTGVRDGLPTVNPTSSPSELIDVNQWLTLFRIITARSAASRDRAETRRLGLEAAQCLDEALKFYEDDNDLPPPSAFFSETSRARLAEAPAEFSRQRLIGLRSRLPTTRHMRDRLLRDETKSPRRRWFGG